MSPTKVRDCITGGEDSDRGGEIIFVQRKNI
jgi:hypothetical protein